MATVTWTFTSSYSGWGFAEEIISGISTASRTHVSGAIRVRLTIGGGGGEVRGLNFSPGVSASITAGDTIEIDISATSDAVNMSTILKAVYTDATSDEITSANNNNARTIILALTGGKTLDTIEVRFRNLFGAALDHTRDLLEVRLITVTPVTGAGQKPLGIDVDLEGGDKIYVTLWDGDLGGDLILKEFDSAIALQNTYTIANDTATIIDIDNRTFFLSTYTPAFFGTASLDDIVYIYGRWDDGAVKHLAKSIDGGASFSEIGDSPTWGADWVGGFFADDANTLYAFVNGVSPALYRSINAGTSWTNLSTLPFDVDAHGVSKHADGRILIANRINAAQMAAFANSPNYASWTNATGSPAFSTVGSGARSIIWVT